MRDSESLESAYSRLCTILNDLRKHNVKKSNAEINLKFINNLRPEWRKFTISYRDVHDTDLHMLVDSLSQYQEEVNAKVAKKTTAASNESLAFMTERKQKGKAKVQQSSPSESEDENEEENPAIAEMKAALVLLTKAFNKQFSKKPATNNQLRYSSGSKKLGWKGKEKKDDSEDSTEKKITCFNCGKLGHYAKECRLPKKKDASYYKKKFELATKAESGKVLVAEEDHWLNDSDSEDEVEEIKALMADTDDEEGESQMDDDSEVDTEIDPSEVFQAQLESFTVKLNELSEALKKEKTINKRLEERNSKNYSELTSVLKENAHNIDQLRYFQKEVDKQLEDKSSLNKQLSELQLISDGLATEKAFFILKNQLISDGLATEN